ncbi:YeeE/YedE family protein [Burkholderia ubonensis]|uniref:YeeE/YedE family protein n=1 Tax=Burkholderia ubonensis TaxID=101571 RepID=UPI0039F60E0E
MRRGRSVVARRRLGAGKRRSGGDAFVAGLIVAPLMLRAAGIGATPQVDASWPVVIAAGLLVGIGTRYAGGCTSGHGVCGLSRGSLRSLVATATFMAVGFLTVFAQRHVPGG